MSDFIDSHGNIVPLPADASVTWRVSGYALIQNDQGQFLMVQSGDGRWHFPGGGVEQAETITDGIVRECLEETGYAVSARDQAPFYLREQRFYHSSEQAFYHSIQLFYRAKLIHQEPDETHITEHEKTRQRQWMTLSELTPDTIHPTVIELVELLIAS